MTDARLTLSGNHPFIKKLSSMHRFDPYADMWYEVSYSSLRKDTSPSYPTYYRSPFIERYLVNNFSVVSTVIIKNIYSPNHEYIIITSENDFIKLSVLIDDQ